MSRKSNKTIEYLMTGHYVAISSFFVRASGRENVFLNFSTDETGQKKGQWDRMICRRTKNFQKVCLKLICADKNQ